MIESERARCLMLGGVLYDKIWLRATGSRNTDMWVPNNEPINFKGRCHNSLLIAALCFATATRFATATQT